MAMLVAHEDRHWQATAKAEKVELGDGDLRRRVVAVITLAGADTEDEAADLLALLPDLKDPSETGRRHAVARWGRDLYPGPRWWNPLEPDLLGEHLVATDLAGFGEVLTGVLQRENPAALAQPLDVYARAVVAYPALSVAVGTVLSGHLETLCRAAIEQAASHTQQDLRGDVGEQASRKVQCPNRLKLADLGHHRFQTHVAWAGLDQSEHSRGLFVHAVEVGHPR